MKVAHALIVSYAALMLSLAAVAIEGASAYLHWFDLPAPTRFPLLMATFLWAPALYGVAVYRRALKAK